MNNIERFNNLMQFKPVDRLPVIEWAAYWDKTLERWYEEGLPRELTDPGDIRDYLGLDSYRQMWMKPYADNCPPVEAYHGGVIKTLDDYQDFKKHLYPAPAAFDKDAMTRWAKSQSEGDTVIWLELDGFFWHPRLLLGIERHMMSFYDDPELIHEINKNLIEYNLRALDEVCDICTPNYVVFAEDMSYNLGPMLSKKCFDNFLTLITVKSYQYLKKGGIKAYIDTDGDVAKLLPWVTEIGIEGILPLERQAGVDVVQIRKDYPEFNMIGAFDKTVMHLGEDAVIQEFERLLPVMQQGGFIPSVDHQTPPAVSLEQYKRYLELLKEYCTKAVCINA